MIWLFLSLLVAAPALGQEPSLAGYTPASAQRERALEAAIIGQPSAERMDGYHRVLTAAPHHAGTEANIKLADYYAARLKAFGFDSVALYRYEVLLPRPITRRVTLLAPEHYELKLAEPPLAADPDTKQAGVLPPYNAYAKDGDVTGEVVYVNYGVPDDYTVLDSLGISVAGKIVIARYGGSWRGIKPKVAAEHGAVGCLISSDPEDDGYVQGDVLPTGKWRPEWGVQRGSVMDMPVYPGDPQTPDRPSLPGVQRIPLDQAQTLVKIPTLPISWGDALPILKHLGGAAVPPAWRGGLPITYHAGPGPARVHMVLKSDWGVRPIVDVIGIIRGSEQPEKIVMVGSQRSSDRPSSDAARNLISATATAARGPIAEVMVCMFGPTSDRYNLLHRGTRVRKMHSSYRSTFRTLGDIPLAMVEDRLVTPLKNDWRPRRDDRDVTVPGGVGDRGAVPVYSSGVPAAVGGAVVGFGHRRVPIARTGLGLRNPNIYPPLERAHAAGVHMYMTLQTLWGFVQMQVYETGREILQLGVVPLANMLPEVAFVKLGWALGVHPDDPAAVERLMTTTIAGEMTEREPHDGYLILQGGVPEVAGFLARVWK